MPDNDTIAAISTPLGQGGIGIIRISGSNSYQTAQSVFTSSKPGSEDFPIPRYLYHGYIKNNRGKLLDEVLVSFMPAPNTYTREDTVEINCHSGIYTLKNILEAVLGNGARLAEPGEFTKRAFLNGRIDLSQAEGVMNIIRARSEEAANIATRTIMGDLSAKIRDLRDELIALRAPMEASFDYPEEFEDDHRPMKVKGAVRLLCGRLRKMLEGAERNRAYQEGVSIAIVGRPNVGKSSLLNALLGQQKAIVHDAPGTTRDLLEGHLTIGGYPVKIIDTAGIQGSSDPVELEGIERARRAAAEAQLIMVVLDSSQPLTIEDLELIKIGEAGQDKLVVLNKADLKMKVNRKELDNIFPEMNILSTAALYDKGLGLLTGKIVSILDHRFCQPDESSLLVSIRQENLMRKVLMSLETIAEQYETLPEELTAFHLEEAYNLLGEIIGETISDALLDKIFSEFCLGK